ncbi:hypothetical protein ACQJBY_054723 [Aegilops geniculata]
MLQGGGDRIDLVPIMSLPPPSPALPSGTTAPMTTAPLLTAPVTSARTSLAGPISTTAPLAPPSPGASTPPPAIALSPEQIAATLQHLVTAVQGLQLQQQQYGAGAYAPPPPAPIAAPSLSLQQQQHPYGGGVGPYAPLPWPSQGAAACGGPLFWPPPTPPTPPSHGPPPAAAPFWSLPSAPSAAPWVQQPPTTAWPVQQPPQTAPQGFLPPPPSTAPLWHLQPLPSPATAAPVQPPPLPLQPPAPPLPSSGAPSLTGLPIHQVWFPPSPSPLPAWVAGSSPGLVYTTAPEHLHHGSGTSDTLPAVRRPLRLGRPLPGGRRPGAALLAAPHRQAPRSWRTDANTATVRQAGLHHIRWH